MILVRTDWPSFDAYLASLSKPARKNYKAISKQYEDVDYDIWIPDRTGDVPEIELRRFMRLWERQLIKGQTIQWAFPVETVLDWAKKGEIIFVKAVRNEESIGMQFIQRRDGYFECHPPMYDKAKYPSLAKWMWFSLIWYAITMHLDPLDLGGMSDDWHENLGKWKTYKHQYKWAFVPRKAKEDPSSEPRYYIEKPLCKLMLR